MADRIRVTLEVNGQEWSVEAWPMERLLDVLRHQLGLTGTKEGCGEGECGACAVLMNGQLVNSCLVPVAAAEGASVVTIEGLRDEALQRSFIEEGGAQCGICTPGMILAASRLPPDADDAAIRAGLVGNLCRCTGYSKIVTAVRRAGRRRVNRDTKT